MGAGYAPHTEDSGYLVNTKGLVLDAGNATPGAHVTIQQRVDNNYSQLWRIRPDGLIESVLTGLVITIPGGVTAPVGTKLTVQHEETGSPSQAWRWAEGEILNTTRQELVLDVEGVGNVGAFAMIWYKQQAPNPQFLRWKFVAPNAINADSAPQQNAVPVSPTLQDTPTPQDSNANPPVPLSQNPPVQEPQIPTQPPPVDPTSANAPLSPVVQSAPLSPPVNATPDPAQIPAQHPHIDLTLDPNANPATVPVLEHQIQSLSVSQQPPLETSQLHASVEVPRNESSGQLPEHQVPSSQMPTAQQQYQQHPQNPTQPTPFPQFSSQYYDPAAQNPTVAPFPQHQPAFNTPFPTFGAPTQPVYPVPPNPAYSNANPYPSHSASPPLTYSSSAYTLNTMHTSSPHISTIHHTQPVHTIPSAYVPTVAYATVPTTPPVATVTYVQPQTTGTVSIPTGCTMIATRLNGFVLDVDKVGDYVGAPVTIRNIYQSPGKGVAGTRGVSERCIWRIDKDGFIINDWTGLVLEVEGECAAKAGKWIRVAHKKPFNHDFVNNQRWRFDATLETFVNYNGLCLDVNKSRTAPGTPLIAWNPLPHHPTNQRFFFIPV